jgi:hypothetical protein
MPERDPEPRRDRAPDDTRKQTRPANEPVRRDDDKPKRQKPGDLERRA